MVLPIAPSPPPPASEPRLPGNSPTTIAIVALPLGLLLNQTAGGFDHLSNALMALLGWQVEPSLLQRHSVRLAAHLLVPALLIFGVLAATPVGRWLVANRLALACLLFADALIAAVAVRGLVRAALNDAPFMTGPLAAITGSLAVASMTIGLASLVLTTLWYRLVAGRPRAVRLCRAIFQKRR
ncbi:hypothetical protein [Xylophilus sp. GOD-11R]|uniref:hypothetical protein n=1 Tax=Xylophilus sp. GOD-11R TaxID=3089814 RepID=UPI00298C3696|nr:hypothetical protein [Xylophilus sp. GOD-11R]WPB55840.1 hypothetical protein R9X41_17045 [Xylophilus sp. GOD-11R]